MKYIVILLSVFSFFGIVLNTPSFAVAADCAAPAGSDAFNECQKQINAMRGNFDVNYAPVKVIAPNTAAPAPVHASAPVSTSTATSAAAVASTTQAAYQAAVNSCEHSMTSSDLAVPGSLDRCVARQLGH